MSTSGRWTCAGRGLDAVSPPQRYKALASKFEQQGDFGKAAQFYAKVVESDPHDLGALTSMAVTLFNAARLQEALPILDRWSHLAPENPMPSLYLGTAYYEVGLLRKAEQEFDRAAQLLPSDPAPPNNLGVVHAQHQNWDRALDYFFKALELAGGDPVIHTNVAYCYTKKGNDEEAKKHFREALRADPNEVTAHYCLGLEFENKGEVGAGDTVRIGEVLKMTAPTRIRLKDYRAFYSTRVEDAGEQELVVAAPMRCGNVVPVRKGTQLVMGVPKEDALYGFYAEVVDRKGGDEPMLVVRRTSSTRRIQRRKFVRIDVSVPVTVRVLGGKGQPRPQVVGEQNLSAGGMLLVLGQKLERSSRVKLDMELPDGPLSCHGEVMRVLRTGGQEAQYETGIEFRGLDEKTKHRVVRYVYRRQVERRRLGI